MDAEIPMSRRPNAVRESRPSELTAGKCRTPHRLGVTRIARSPPTAALLHATVSTAPMRRDACRWGWLNCGLLCMASGMETGTNVFEQKEKMHGVGRAGLKSVSKVPAPRRLVLRVDQHSANPGDFRSLNRSDQRIF